ncbi:hypothetical protein A2572_03465 [Candidatus Collierbacteria bacterium RIFOXYD1_FULL_40_9]|uniref:Zinc/iron-chelating domain-containing protein n=1 Tax=Candidatus Collierbacteria bacterium RIFOXYD1_FULL_40_9 TaxID=1817731 RepID=A0A1F5FX43_9BACT|nr:MAG: hypothetical protein A2572_03465 [Candidatus Collierbacteria bacterium RIFOXYD1_FULL_40_9]
MQNTCNGCTLCCKLLAIPELKKPLNTSCQFCAVGVGCNIYPNRPLSCRKFNCLYITGNLDKKLKPKDCHVVFEKLPNCAIYLALIDPDFPNAINEEVVKNQITQLLQNKFSVITSSGPNSTKNLMLAEGVTQEEVWTKVNQAYKLMNL